jgi:hypothetical protein
MLFRTTDSDRAPTRSIDGIESKTSKEFCTIPVTSHNLHSLRARSPVIGSRLQAAGLRPCCEAPSQLFGIISAGFAAPQAEKLERLRTDHKQRSSALNDKRTTVVGTKSECVL